MATPHRIPVPTLWICPGFELIWYQQPVFLGPNVLVLRLRSRAGLLSRNGDEVACFAAPDAAVGPEWRFGHARFTAANQVEVSAADGTTWSIPFDSRSLGI